MGRGGGTGRAGQEGRDIRRRFHTRPYSLNADCGTPGIFVEKFKLHLAAEVDARRSTALCVLPPDKTGVDLASDYLRALVDHFAPVLCYRDPHDGYFTASHQCSDKCPAPKPASRDEIQWCSTVPALWDQTARLRTLECARRAGLISNAAQDNVILALEPEAASVYCFNSLQNIAVFVSL